MVMFKTSLVNFRTSVLLVVTALRIGASADTMETGILFFVSILTGNSIAVRMIVFVGCALSSARMSPANRVPASTASVILIFILFCCPNGHLQAVRDPRRAG